MTFICLDNGVWMNLRYIRSVRVELKEIVVETEDYYTHVYKTFTSEETAKTYLHNHMQWSINGG